MAEKRDRIDIRQPVPLNVEPEYKTTRTITDEDRTIARLFGMPECTLDLIDFFFTKEDQEFIDSIFLKRLA
jgi:hypothetical protein